MYEIPEKSHTPYSAIGPRERRERDREARGKAWQSANEANPGAVQDFHDRFTH